MGSLDNRTALITGASRGIGEACARALAAEGARVALAARSLTELERIAADLDDAVVLETDLAGAGAAVDLASRSVEALGGVDIVVNNAGISSQQGTPTEVMHLNYHVPLELTEALVDQMADRGHGSVIHMSSIAGAMGVGEIGTYGPSKAAIDGLTRVQASQFGSRGVRVNAVAPGLIVTELWADGRRVPGLADALEGHVALGRWGEPDDIAGVVAFLAGDAARYVTGQVIAVDGGFHSVTAWGNYL